MGYNKKAIVTGGSRGIGAGIALKLAEEGYDLAISYASKKDAAEAVAAQVKERYDRTCHIFHAVMEEEGVA